MNSDKRAIFVQILHIFMSFVLFVNINYVAPRYFLNREFVLKNLKLVRKGKIFTFQTHFVRISNGFVVISLLPSLEP